MKAILLGTLALGALGLCGCNPALNPDLISHKYIVHMPPGKFFTCPLVTLPNTFVLDRDVARTLVNAYNSDKICHQNMDAIKADLLNQAKIYGTK